MEDTLPATDDDQVPLDNHSEAENVFVPNDVANVPGTNNVIESEIDSPSDCFTHSVRELPMNFNHKTYEEFVDLGEITQFAHVKLPVVPFAG